MLLIFGWLIVISAQMHKLRTDLRWVIDELFHQRKPIAEMTDKLEQIAELLESLSIDSAEIPEGLTDYEKHVMERDHDFDQRIRLMKEELALSNDRPMHTPLSVAEELHPDVKNLPHSIIKDDQDVLPDVEYTQ